MNRFPYVIPYPYICADKSKSISFMKEYIMSFFNAPVTNKIPTCICSVAGLHTYISTNPQLEELTRKVRTGLGDKQVFRKNKQTLLPYVTPAGIFSYCKEQCMQVPSGLFVIDIDELASTEEAAMWRDRLFADARVPAHWIPLHRLTGACGRISRTCSHRPPSRWSGRRFTKRFSMASPTSCRHTCA